MVRAACPSCSSSSSELFLKVKDFRVSGDFFDIHRCTSCGLHYTKEIPSLNEIGLFYKSDTYDSHRLDNHSLISRIYRLVREINLKRKIAWLRRHLSKGVVVDYGCGLGHFVNALNRNGFDARGFEIDADVRALSSKTFNHDIYPLEDFCFLDNKSVDAITMWHVLEHVYDLNVDFERITAKLKIGGVLMIAVPNFKSYDAWVYRENWEAYDVPRHLYHFDKSTLISFVKAFGFEHNETLPMKFDSYYVSMRSEKNLKRGSTMRGVWTGFKSNWKSRDYGYSSHVFVFKKL